MSSSPNLAEIFGKIGDAICVLDKDRQVVFANEKGSQVLNSAEAGFHNELSKALSEHAARRFEYFHKALNRWFEHQTYPNEDGGITLFSRDVTSRHRLEEALRASEERFRRLIDSNIIGVIGVTDEYIMEANDVFLRTVGYTRTDLVTAQLRWRDMTPPEYDTLDKNAEDELRETGAFALYEKEFIRKDGSRVAVLISGVQMKREPNETLSLVVDLSARKRADRRMECMVEASKILASSLECEQTFAGLAEYIVGNLADCCMIFIKEEDDVLQRVAISYSIPRTGISEPDINVDRVMALGESEIMLDPISRIVVPIVARDEPVGVIVVIANRPDAFDGDDLHLFNELGRRAGLAVENARLYQGMQRANRLKDEFVAIVSHELRTPLTPILGGVYMLRSESHDREILNKALDLIERNAKAQVKIVDDLLDVSRIISGKLRLNMDSVELGSVILAAVETVRPAADAKGIHVDVRLSPVAGTIQGDADRLQQVVWNLLANSVKFTPPNGHITVALVQTLSHAEIHVTDTGIGIEAGFLPYVFERFRQADTSRTRVHGGLGLGLAIVRHLVESHGGTVQADSSGDEQGATFVVRLPVRAVVRTGAS